MPNTSWERLRILPIEAPPYDLPIRFSEHVRQIRSIARLLSSRRKPSRKPRLGFTPCSLVLQRRDRRTRAEGSSRRMKHRDRLGCFEVAQNEVRRLDLVGKAAGDIDVYRQYQRRNSFGLDPDMKLYRIFQEHFYELDVNAGCLTLPRATATVWSDPLENPLASVTQPDSATSMTVHLGSVVSSFYALCWTRRDFPTKADWDSFSHGGPAVRIATTVGKLLDRVMLMSDPCYMHRSWVIDVDYKAPGLISQMKTPSEVLARMETTGAKLALSAAIIRTGFSDEDEVRFLFDNGIHPPSAAVATSTSPDLLRLPFDWSDFVDNAIRYP